MSARDAYPRSVLVAATHGAPGSSLIDATLLVIAKAPIAGSVKTRLSPPYDADQAAMLARAALVDTLRTVAAVPVRRRRIVLDGPAGDWLPSGFEVTPQSDGPLGKRLASAFAAAEGPTLLVGMDTPQVDPDLLRAGLLALTELDFDAVLGPTLDGGYWTIGLRCPRPDVFDGVPMSSSRTCARQLERLAQLGLRTFSHRVLRDVDYFADAKAVAQMTPGSAFASVFARLS